MKQPRHPRHSRIKTDATVSTLPATAALPAVATDPATRVLPAVAIDPATAALPAVFRDPATAALPAVDWEPITPTEFFLAIGPSQPIGAPAAASSRSKLRNGS